MFCALRSVGRKEKKENANNSYNWDGSNEIILQKFVGCDTLENTHNTNKGSLYL